jgi:MFS family permease
MSQGPYIGSFPGQPDPDETKPPVLLWYNVYCIALALVYLLLLGGLIAALALDPGGTKTEDLIIFGVLAVTCVPLFLFYAAAPFLPARPWAWIWGIVAIAIGLTSACCLPACVPLLIHWMKPETKRYFGRT